MSERLNHPYNNTASRLNHALQPLVALGLVEGITEAFDTFPFLSYRYYSVRDYREIHFVTGTDLILEIWEMLLW